MFLSMVMNREEIYKLFGDKDLTYVFSRVRINTDREKARDTIQVRGSLLEEDLNLTDMEGLMLEMLLGDQFVPFYQHLISLSYDTRTPDKKLYDFSVSLYQWVSERVGYIPDWVLPNREEHLTTIINHVLVTADDYIPDSEVLLGLLLRNTNFQQNKQFKEQLRLGVWSATETGLTSIVRAEEDYLQGKTDPSVDSLSLYVRIAERGYRDTDTLKRYMSHRSFQETILTDEESVCRELNDFMTNYGQGDRWVGFTDELYGIMTQIPLKRVSIERPNLNQIVFRDKTEGEDVTVQFTFSDKIVVNVRKETSVSVAYNQDYYKATFEAILNELDKYTYRANTVIRVVNVLLKNIPMRIPNKERELRYDESEY